MKKPIAIWLVSGALVMSSCGGGTSTENTTQTSPTVDTVAVEEEHEDANIIFPSIMEVMMVFQQAGLPYLEGITSDLSKVDEYNTNVSRSIHTGFYSTDLAYNLLNDNNQKALEYFRAVNDLSTKLGIESVYESQDLVKRFEETLGNKDSSLVIMTELQNRTDTYVDRNDLHNIATVVFAGAWVQGMHLGVMANDDYSRSNVSYRISEQMRILNNVVIAIKNSNPNPNAELSSFIENLESLNNYYMQLEEVASYNDLGTPELSLSSISEIANRIEVIRESV